jgi:hypothetical protein
MQKFLLCRPERVAVSSYLDSFEYAGASKLSVHTGILKIIRNLSRIRPDAFDVGALISIQDSYKFIQLTLKLLTQGSISTRSRLLLLNIELK